MLTSEWPAVPVERTRAARKVQRPSGERTGSADEAEPTFARLAIAPSDNSNDHSSSAGGGRKKGPTSEFFAKQINGIGASEFTCHRTLGRTALFARSRGPEKGSRRVSLIDLFQVARAERAPELHDMIVWLGEKAGEREGKRK